MRPQFLLTWRLVALSLAFAVTHLAVASSDVTVEIEGQLRLDGPLQIKIWEKGSNEIGEYKRTFVFTATADRGAILTSSIKNYKAVCTFPGGNSWTTSSVPAGGFIYIYLKENKHPFVNIELLEFMESLPTPMSINGVHPVRFCLGDNG